MKVNVDDISKYYILLYQVIAYLTEDSQILRDPFSFIILRNLINVILVENK